MYADVAYLGRQSTIKHTSQDQKRRNKQKRPEHPSVENLRLFEE